MKIVLPTMYFFMVIIATNAATIQRSNIFNLSSSKFFTNEVATVTKPSTTTTTTPAPRTRIKKRAFQLKRLTKSDCEIYCQKNKFTRTYLVRKCKATDRPVRCRRCRSRHECFRLIKIFPF